ncbi:hypothetical protein EV715DRAFT_214145 [Schizophyllum commune]
MEEPQNPPASGGTKTFGIHKYNPEYCLGSDAQRENRRRGYEDKYEDDALYEELGDEARIWRVMLDEGRANDAAMLQRFRDHLDVDLVFAGLFSAVLTTFVVQTSQTPPKTGDTTVALLLEIIAIQRAWANNPRVDDVASFSLTPPSPSPSPWINRCWYLSLIFSLLAAFGAVVVRQWLQEYESEIPGPSKRRALVRHYRRVGLENYKVHLIVPILPILLHVSLLLFFIGLTLYVRQFDRSMSNGIIALTVMIYLVYLATNLMPIFHPQCPYRSPLSTGAIWVKALVSLLHGLSGRHFTTKLPRTPYTLRLCWMALCIITSLWKTRIRMTCTPLSHRLLVVWAAFKDNWKEVFRTPDAHEWETVLDSLETLIPHSLQSLVQASSDLSIAPLVVQASSSLPINPIHYDESNCEDLPHSKLLRYHIHPWLTNALTTRRSVFDWVPGREHELQRMSCALLLVPLRESLQEDDRMFVPWEEVDMAQHRACVVRVFQALKSGLLNMSNMSTATATDVATLSVTLLALTHHYVNIDGVWMQEEVFDAIAKAYSSVPDTDTLTKLRLRPVIWHHALEYLCFSGMTMDDAAHFAITLWQSMSSEAPCSNDDTQIKIRLAASSRVTLQEWLYLRPDSSTRALIAIHRLLCPDSCEAFDDDMGSAIELTHASRLHMTCHAIDSYIKGADGNAAFKDNLGFLAVQLIGTWLACLRYESIDSALHVAGHLAVWAAFSSTFCFHSGLIPATLVDANGRLPATYAESLFFFFVKLSRELLRYTPPEHLDAACEIILTLDRHTAEYCGDLAGIIENTDGFIKVILLAVERILKDPKLAVSDIPDALAESLATQLSKVTVSKLSDLSDNDVTQCLYLDSLCAARVNTGQINSKFPNASHRLHSALLALKPTYHDMWRRKLLHALRYGHYFPLVAALSSKSAHGYKVLVEWLDDLPMPELRLRVPDEAREGTDLNWYRLFTTRPNKHIRAAGRDRRFRLDISGIVPFEVAVERILRSNTENIEEWDDDDEDEFEDAENTQDEIYVEPMGILNLTLLRITRPYSGALACYHSSSFLQRYVS